MYRECVVYDGGNDLLWAEVFVVKVFVLGDFVVVEGGWKYIYIVIVVEVFSKDCVSFIGEIVSDRGIWKCGLWVGLCKNKDWVN